MSAPTKVRATPTIPTTACLEPFRDLRNVGDFAGRRGHSVVVYRVPASGAGALATGGRDLGDDSAIDRNFLVILLRVVVVRVYTK